MVYYRRNYQKGGCYFFTVTLRNRQSSLLTQHIDLLRLAMRNVQQKNFYAIKAIVILPDHILAI